MKVAVESKAKANSNGQSEPQSMHCVAIRCRREIRKKLDSKHENGSGLRAAVQYLHQPFRQSMGKVELLPPSSARHLMKLLAPLLQENLGTGHRTIDRCEPVAAGIDASLRWIANASPLPTDLRQKWILHSLLPLYLQVSPTQNQANLSLAETTGLLRDYVSLTILNDVLEGDLVTWLAGQSSCFFAPNPLGRVGIDLAALSQAIWQKPLNEELPTESMRSSENPFSLAEPRRAALASLVLPWLDESMTVSIPKELGIEKLAWGTLRSHFRQWLQLISNSTPSEHSDSDSDTVIGEIGSPASIESTTLELIDGCHEEIGQLISSPDSTRRDHNARTEMFEDHPIGHPAQEKSSSSSKRDARRDQPTEDLRLFEPNQDRCVVEIRSSEDPKLVRSLDEQLSDCRARQGSIALVLARTLQPEKASQPDGQLAVWQRAFVEHLRTNAESEELRGFITKDGEVAMLLEDLDKPVVAAIVREGLQSAAATHRAACGLGSDVNLALISGVSFVASPARSFQIKQLIDAGWRCLDGAAVQGSGAVKSIEVY